MLRVCDEGVILARQTPTFRLPDDAVGRVVVRWDDHRVLHGGTFGACVFNLQLTDVVTGQVWFLGTRRIDVPGDGSQLQHGGTYSAMSAHVGAHNGPQPGHTYFAGNTSRSSGTHPAG